MYKQKFNEAERLLESLDATAYTQIKQVSQTMKFYTDSINEIEEGLVFEEESVDIGKGKKLTYIELRKRRQAYMKQQGLIE